MTHKMAADISGLMEVVTLASARLFRPLPAELAGTLFRLEPPASARSLQRPVPARFASACCTLALSTMKSVASCRQQNPTLLHPSSYYRGANVRPFRCRAATVLLPGCDYQRSPHPSQPGGAPSLAKSSIL